jgi:hypothetical protein
MEIQKIFYDVETIYLVGGAVRDAIRDLPPRDFDFKIICEPRFLIMRLEELGYRYSDAFNIVENEYYYNPHNGCVSIVVDGRDIDLAVITTNDIGELIENGDVNLNCCAYDVQKHCVVNPDKLEEIETGILRFCNPESASKDPSIILNALKLVSRDPTILPAPETLETISDSIDSIASFISTRPIEIHKLHSIGGNVNTGEVIQLILGSNANEDSKQLLIKTINSIGPRSYAVPGFEKISGVDQDTKDEITAFVNERYGKAVDSEKVAALFGSDQTVYLNRDGTGRIVSLFSLEGSRVYTTSAINEDEYREMLSTIRRHVPYPWGSVDMRNQRVQALVLSAGFHQISNPLIAKKLLTGDNRTFQESPFGVVAYKNGVGEFVYGK